MFAGIGKLALEEFRLNAHGFLKTETSFGSDPLGLAEIFHHSAQSFAIDFNPAPSNQREPIRLSQQLPHLGIGQWFAVERDFHAEIEQCILAHSRQHLRSCMASDGLHRNGWKISPASTMAFSHGQLSEAR